MAYFGGEKEERTWPRWEFSLEKLNLFVALALILLAAYLLTGEGKGGSEESAQAQEEVIMAEVLVPIRNISQGTKLAGEMFRKEARSVVGIENKYLTDASAVAETYARSLIIAGTPLLKDHLAASYTNVITGKIPLGHRAVAIPVNASSGVEGWVQPGARVDVVWSTKHLGRQIVSIIVQNAEVLSAERSTESDTARIKDAGMVPSHVTLLVKNKDAQKLQLAKTAKGSLSLSLRGDHDINAIGSETTSIDKLFSRRDLQTFEEGEMQIFIGKKEYMMKAGKLVPSGRTVKKS